MVAMPFAPFSWAADVMGVSSFLGVMGVVGVEFRVWDFLEFGSLKSVYSKAHVFFSILILIGERLTFCKCAVM